jgi:agmatinase
MVHFHRSTVDTIADANIVLIGVPDESKSHAKRKGTSRGPDTIRFASNESEFFKREGKIIPISPMRDSLENKKVLDLGNIKRENLYQLIFDLVSNKKIPIIIGGDHSITTLALEAIGNALGKIGLLYFDAHPDFVSSTRNYYGSVLTDSAASIDFNKSTLIGTRAAEPEELGILQVSQRFMSRAGGKKKYISIDLDCLDPAFAPAVSVPSPGGLTSIDLIYLIKKAVHNGIVGIDIVELSPDFDVNSMTAYLAARILLEVIASIK